MQENPLQVKSELADAELTPRRFVKLTSTGIDVATAGTDKIYGVMNKANTVPAGETAPVITEGTAIVEASAAISKGAYVTATTGGKAVATTTAGHVVRGMALEAADADGDMIEIQLTFFHHKA
ncbi:DUF2190 family protein [Streptomyces cinereoruber]|uniref:DUF2190 family protein n=1 Tax=Streptomyces cinereoruber TaxID=67260 RepID=UPI00362E9345